MTTAASLAQARAIAESASDTPILLSQYTGSATDLSYLRTYVAEACVDLYGVDATIFDTPNLISTTLLRDFVHRAIYGNPAAVELSSVPKGQLVAAPYSDVASALRYPAAEACGFITIQLMNVYRAFGYEATLVDALNGELGPTLWQGGTNPYAFDSGHVTLEVKVNELPQAIIQDSHFNMMALNADGKPLGMLALREYVFGDDLTPTFDVFDSYVYSRAAGPPIEHWEDFDPATRAFWEDTFPLVLYAWADDSLLNYKNLGGLATNWNTFHTAPQGDSFATIADAQNAAAPFIRGEWSGAVQALRADHYATGFRLIDERGAIAGEWVTLGLEDGSFVSINVQSGELLNGSYDQLVLDAAGVGRNLNPGVDLSAFFNSVEIITAAGAKIADWNAADVGRFYEHFGSASAEALYGHAGIDIFFGSGGDDLLIGKGGGDTYHVNSDGDQVVELAGDEGRDLLYSSVNRTLPANVEVLLLRGAAVYGVGNSGNNEVFGTALHNVLYGTLGKDSLVGGAGVDQFVFLDQAGFGFNKTTVTDFDAATETVVFSKSIYNDIFQMMSYGFEYTAYDGSIGFRLAHNADTISLMGTTKEEMLAHLDHFIFI